jgi:signal transduction histidine kinase
MTRAWQRLSARQVDWLVFAATFAVALVRVGREASAGRLDSSLAVLPFATLPLLWRRRCPGRALAVLAAALAASLALDRAVPSNVGVLFGLYAAALYGDERVRALSGAMAGLLTAVPLSILIAGGGARSTGHLTPAIALGAGAAWLLGEVIRTHRAYLAEVEQRAARLVRERDEQLRRATEQERLRIARELHDVVTHNVSVIAVHAGAAHSTSGSHPQRATEALSLIERTARATLGELRTLLGVLRADGPAAAAPLRPRPSLRQLDELAARTRAAGVEVELRVLGDAVPLDAAVELAAYRVLQEGLTNVVKHAPGTTARVLVRYGARELELTVDDDGAAPAHGGPGGNGLVGLRERVELVGGELRAGPLPGGGFGVTARLPLAPTRLGAPRASLAARDRPAEPSHGADTDGAGAAGLVAGAPAGVRSPLAG